MTIQELTSIGLKGPRPSSAEAFFSNYIGKRILFTGGRGFLGSQLIRLLAQVDCQMICLTREKKESSLPEDKRLREEVGDIQKRETWERVLEGVDFVFHLAAQTNIAVAQENPLADFNINVLPLLHLAQTCRERGRCPVVIFAGTVTEAGIPQYLPVDENHPDHPITIYDLHKWMAEQYLKHYIGRGILRGVILRLANLYGSGPVSRSPGRGVLNRMISKALEGEMLTIYGAGNELRDYLYVEDAARAFLMAGAHIEGVNGRHFVIGSGKAHTLSEAFHRVADQVALTTGQKVEIRHIEAPVPLSPIEARNFVADSRSFSQMTGWFPRISLREGIARTIEAMR